MMIRRCSSDRALFAGRNSLAHLTTTVPWYPPPGVGKSSLLARFIGRPVDPKHVPTIGMDFGLQTIVEDGTCLKLQVPTLEPMTFSARAALPPPLPG
jgi:hypothetical protein